MQFTKSIKAPQALKPGEVARIEYGNCIKNLAIYGAGLLLQTILSIMFWFISMLVGTYICKLDLAAPVYLTVTL